MAEETKDGGTVLPGNMDVDELVNGGEAGGSTQQPNVAEEIVKGHYYSYGGKTVKAVGTENCSWKVEHDDGTELIDQGNLRRLEPEVGYRVVYPSESGARCTGRIISKMGDQLIIARTGTKAESTVESGSLLGVTDVKGKTTSSGVRAVRESSTQVRQSPGAVISGFMLDDDNKFEGVVAIIRRSLNGAFGSEEFDETKLRISYDRGDHRICCRGAEGKPLFSIFADFKDLKSYSAVRSDIRNSGSVKMGSRAERRKKELMYQSFRRRFLVQPVEMTSSERKLAVEVVYITGVSFSLEVLEYISALSKMIVEKVLGGMNTEGGLKVEALVLDSPIRMENGTSFDDTGVSVLVYKRGLSADEIGSIRDRFGLKSNGRGEVELIGTHKAMTFSSVRSRVEWPWPPTQRYVRAVQDVVVVLNNELGLEESRIVDIVVGELKEMGFCNRLAYAESGNACNRNRIPCKNGSLPCPRTSSSWRWRCSYTWCLLE
jgi:hypothetical protein